MNEGTNVGGGVELATWPTVDKLALFVEQRATYARTRARFALYLDWATDVQIKAACGVGRVQTNRLLTE